jgi:polyisoprenyl-phosphate glycosyltransferase
MSESSAVPDRPPSGAQIVLSVVIPLYREASHLSTTLAEIVGALDRLDTAYELILIEDGSPDGTWALITEFCRRHPRARGLRLSRNFGKEAALAAGLERACGQAVLLMDGDLQHPPALIAAMLQHWRDGADVVEGVKQRRQGDSASQRWRAELFYRLFSWLSGYELGGASDFKLMDRRVLEAWRRMGERNLFFRGMHAWLGFKRVQLAFQVPPRTGGESAWGVLELVRLAMVAVTSFSSAPLQLISLAGIAFAAFAVLLGAQTLYLKFSGVGVTGFTTVILLLLTIGSAMMLGLGIIGTYIARIYEEVKARPRYIVAEEI